MAKNGCNCDSRCGRNTLREAPYGVTKAGAGILVRGPWRQAKDLPNDGRVVMTNPVETCNRPGRRMKLEMTDSRPPAFVEPTPPFMPAPPFRQPPLDGSAGGPYAPRGCPVQTGPAVVPYEFIKERRRRCADELRQAGKQYIASRMPCGDYSEDPRDWFPRPGPCAPSTSPATRPATSGSSTRSSIRPRDQGRLVDPFGSGVVPTQEEAFRRKADYTQASTQEVLRSPDGREMLAQALVQSGFASVFGLGCDSGLETSADNIQIKDPNCQCLRDAGGNIVGPCCECRPDAPECQNGHEDKVCADAETGEILTCPNGTNSKPDPPTSTPKTSASNIQVTGNVIAGLLLAALATVG